MSRGRLFNDLRDYDRAIADFDLALRGVPDFADAYFGRAYSWLRKGDNDRALADYDQVIRLQPNKARVYLYRSSVWRLKRNKERTDADLAEAYRLDPQLNPRNDPRFKSSTTSKQ